MRIISVLEAQQAVKDSVQIQKYSKRKQNEFCTSYFLRWFPFATLKSSVLLIVWGHIYPVIRPKVPSATWH